MASGAPAPNTSDLGRRLGPTGPPGLPGGSFGAPTPTAAPAGPAPGSPAANWAALAAYGAAHPDNGLSGLNANNTINSSYLTAFQGALGDARSHINNQLAAALADIGSNEKAANGMLGSLPGQINDTYGSSRNETARGAMLGVAAEHNAGFTHPLMDLSQQMAPEIAAMRNSQNYQLANVPLMQQGAQQEFARERADANLTAQDKASALDLEGARAAMQAGSQTQSENNALALERMREAHDTSASDRANLIREGDLQQQHGWDVQNQTAAAQAQAARDRVAAAGAQPSETNDSALYDWTVRAGDPRAASTAANWAGVFNGSGLTGNALTAYIKTIIPHVTDPVARSYLQSRLLK